MKFYQSRLVQILLAVIYVLVSFGLLWGHNILSPWVPIAVLLLFCALWENVKYVLLSTLLMLVTAVPIWWYTIAPHQAGYLDILGWYPLIILNFVMFVLLPEIIIVWGRNAAIRRYVN